VKSPESLTRVPSPEYWRRFEVAGVDDEGSFSKLFGEGIVDVDEAHVFLLFLLVEEFPL